MFAESRGRVISMALIHERLYGAPDLSRVDFDDYIRRLAEDLYHSHSTSNSDVAFEVEVSAPMLSIEKAVPCGLLLNELISNSLKHAFKGQSQGWIKVRLEERERMVHLCVSDSGVGFPEGFRLQDCPSLGMQLVQTLVEQLHGQVEIRPGAGSQVAISFPLVNESDKDL